MSPKNLKNSESTSLKGIENIGIVDSDNTRLSPIAQILLNRAAVESKNAAVRGMRFSGAGFNRSNENVADSAKGFLQKRGFGNTEFMKPQRIDKYWLKTKDLIIVTENYLKDKVIFDFFPTASEEWEKKVIVINELAGISEPIQEPLNDPSADMKPIYELLERCCQGVIKRLENAN